MDFVLLNLGYIKVAGLGDRLSMDRQEKRGARNNSRFLACRSTSVMVPFSKARDNERGPGWPNLGRGWMNGLL